MQALVRLITRKISSQFMRSLGTAVLDQETQRTVILAYLENTQYVRAHGGAPATYADFTRQFPVVTYETIYPYIHQSLMGQTDVLVPGVISDFAKSSGTTNAKSKYIPINEKSLQDNHYAAGAAAVAWAIEKHGLYDVPLYKTLGISGSFTAVPDMPASVRAGDVSAFLNTLVPVWARAQRFPPQDIALGSDWNTKKDWIVTNAASADVRSIVGTPTWVLRILEGIQKTGKQVSDVWPHLRLFIHGAVAFGPYQASFQKLTSDMQVHLAEAYNATEGFFAFGDADTNGMYLLTNHGVFYEFVPKGAWHTENPHAIPLSQVQVGVDYALVVTGYNGLVRYMIGDVIRFTNTNPYTIQIVGRTKHFINAFGEEVLGSQLEQSLTHACNTTHARITAFTVAPCFYDNGKGCHQWLIEFEQEPTSLEVFTHCIDTHLRSLNSDYEAKRNGSGILDMPKITLAPAGAFMRYLAAHNKLGGQHKVPVVMNDRGLIEEVLSF